MQSGHVGVSLTPEELSSAPELEELLLDELSFFAQEMTVRLKSKGRELCKKFIHLFLSKFSKKSFLEVKCLGYTL